MPKTISRRPRIARWVLHATVFVVLAGAAIGVATAVPWNTPTPRTIPYKGFLEKNGTAVNLPVRMDFALYNVETGGSALWSDSFDPVTVTNGRFSVVLGSGVALPDIVFQTDTLYLQIAVDDSGGNSPVVLGKRQRLHASPFAVRTERARYADYADRTDHGVPTGTMMIWPSDSGLIPPGWLPANGACLKKADNQELRDVIGERWNATTGQGACAADEFALPDFRGRFLRGADMVYWFAGVDASTIGLNRSAGRDPDVASRIGGLLNEGEKVGSSQDDQFKAHTHWLSWQDTNGSDGESGTGWDTGDRWQNTFWTKETGNAGGNETRPRNVYVQFIIKCGPNDACP